MPLGGNRNGKFRTSINLMITMLLGALWHGANWTFVVWGGLHGLFLAVEKLIQDFREKPEPVLVKKRAVVIQGVSGSLFETIAPPNCSWYCLRSCW